MAFKRTVTLRASFRFPAIRFDAPKLLSFSGFTHAHAKCPPVALETLRPDNGDVHENVAEKLTSHPFTLFRDYSKGLSYLKEGNSGSS